MSSGPLLPAEPWPNRAAFEAWWREHVITFNRLSVTDPEEWERIARKVEKFQRDNPQ